MSEMGDIIRQSGIVSDADLSEFKRWRTPGSEVDPSAESIDSAAELVGRIEQVLQSKGLILVQLTDLDVIPQYLRSQKMGKLHLQEGEIETDIDIVFGRATSGDYILPWVSQLIEELLEEGQAHLLEDGRPVYFSSTRVLFFGETKAFVTCTPAP